MFKAKIEINHALSAGNGIIRAPALALSGPIEFSIHRAGVTDPVLGPQGWQPIDHWFAAHAHEENNSCLIEVGPNIVDHLSFSNYRMWIRRSGSEERTEGILTGGALRTSGGTNASAVPAQESHGVASEQAGGTEITLPPPRRPDPGRQGVTGRDVPATQTRTANEQLSSGRSKSWTVIVPLAVLALAAIIWILGPYGREWFRNWDRVGTAPTSQTTPVPDRADSAPMRPIGSTKPEFAKKTPPPPVAMAPTVSPPQHAPAVPSPVPPAQSYQPPHAGSPPDQPQLTGLQDIRNFLAGNPSADEAFRQGVKTWASGASGEAFILFKYAANNGNAQAATEIGRMYDPLQEGKAASDFPRDAGTAAEWYEKSKAGGDADAEKYIEALRGWLSQNLKNGDASARNILNKMP